MSLLSGHAPVLLGEGVQLFEVNVPTGLADRPLRETGIGSRTGMSVVALEQGGQFVTQLTSETVLPATGRLLLLGSSDQRQVFAEAFETGRVKITTKVLD